MVLAAGGKPWEPSRVCNAYELGKRRGGSVPRHLGGAIAEKLSGIVSTRLIRRTDPAPIHERMPAVLGDSELADYLAGEVTAFAPKADALEVTDAVNPLSGKPVQGELF